MSRNEIAPDGLADLDFDFDIVGNEPIELDVLSSAETLALPEMGASAGTPNCCSSICN